MFRKFKILNESEIEFLTEHLTRKIQSWCDSWAPETKFEIKVQNPYRDNGSSHAFLEQSEIVIYELNLNEWLLLFKEQVFNSRFIFDTYGLESGKQITGKPSDLVQEFSEKAVKEMMEAILSATETGSCSSRGLSRDSDEDIVKDSMDKGRGTALVTISMSGLQINIIMSPMAVSAIIPKKNIGSEYRARLEKRSSAIGNGKISIYLEIGDVELDFASLSDLKVNDVIALDKKNDEPFKVITDGGKYLCNGYLGLSDKTTSVQLVRGMK